MEISRNGATLTNDQLQVAGTLTYGGPLTVSDLGPSALAAGNSFQVFSASGYSGAFTSVTLPPLSAGLTWTNKLLVNGSIQVLSVLSSRIGNIAQSGTNVVISGTNGPPNGTYFVLASTNISLPLTNWAPVLTNQFDAQRQLHFHQPDQSCRAAKILQYAGALNSIQCHPPGTKLRFVPSRRVDDNVLCRWVFELRDVSLAIPGSA
jgi:hypothetical protein